jgi:hypothetical protein
VSTASNHFRGSGNAPPFSSARPLSALEAKQAQALADILTARHEQGAPLRVRRQRSGRFDPRSAMRAERDPDDVRLFAKVERTPEPEALAVVVVLDLSWSMTVLDTDQQAVSATAVLVEALRIVGGECAVFAFTERAYIVKAFDQPELAPPRPRGLRGSTGAAEAENHARQALEIAVRHNGGLEVGLGDGGTLPAARSGWRVTFRTEAAERIVPLAWGASAVPALIEFFTQEVA